MFVPSLSWQNDRFYIEMAQKCRFSQEVSAARARMAARGQIPAASSTRQQRRVQQQLGDGYYDAVDGGGGGDPSVWRMSMQSESHFGGDEDDEDDARDIQVLLSPLLDIASASAAASGGGGGGGGAGRTSPSHGPSTIELAAAAVRKTHILPCLFILQMHHFTKTGSGQS
jgi:hypothetical protein